MCYYIAGHFRLSGDVCNASNINFKVFAYLASLLPYWWRLMQVLQLNKSVLMIDAHTTT
jgi:hypothetical protein